MPRAATRAPKLPYLPPQAERHHYLFIRPCGCPEGLAEASATKPGGPPRLSDEDAAWDAMYSRAGEREARARGIYVVHVDHATYERDWYELMLARCSHNAGSGA